MLSKFENKNNIKEKLIKKNIKDVENLKNYFYNMDESNDHMKNSIPVSSEKISKTNLKIK